MNTVTTEDDIDLLEYWRVVWRRRVLIGGLFVLAVILATGWTLFMPKVYESTVTIFPPMDSGSSGGGMAAAASALGGGGLGIGLGGMSATPVDLFVAMLKSKTLGEMVASQLELARVFGVDTEEDAGQILEGSTKVSTSSEKVIKITVEARDPQLAADIANAYPVALNQLNQKVSINKAGQHRQFLAKRTAEAKIDLDKAEGALADFQTRNKTVSLDQQASGALKAAADIQGRISATEVQLQVLQGFATPNNPDVVKLKLELEELRQQLYTLESGKGGKGMLPGDRLHPAFVTVPSLGMEYARLLREFKVQETVYTMLASQLEQAEITEARDMPTVQVLDPAKPAKKESRPSMKLNVMLAGILALCVGVFLAFVMEYFQKVREQGKAQAL